MEEYFKKMDETQVILRTPEEIAKGDPNDNWLPFSEDIIEASQHFGENIILTGPGENEGVIYRLVGISSTFEDVYYVLIDSDGNEVCGSCCSDVRYLGSR